MKNYPRLVAQNLYLDEISGNYLGMVKVNGRKKWKSFKTTDRKRADSKLNAWKIELEMNAPSSDMKLSTLVATFLAARAGKKAADQERYMAAIFKTSFPPGMATLVQKIKASDLLIWLNAQEKKRAWSPRTFNRYRLFLRQLFDVAEADSVITEATNPFKPKFIKTKGNVETLREIPTAAEFDAIIESVRDHCKYHRHHQAPDFLAFQGLAALGQAEVSKLRWSDIGEDSISVQRQKTGARFEIPIYAWLAPLIEKLSAKRQDVFRDAPIFHLRDAGTALTTACKRLKLPLFTQRNLRCHGIARLAHAGIPSSKTAEWQGHKDDGKLIRTIYRKVKCSDDAERDTAMRAKVQSPKIVPMRAVA